MDFVFSMPENNDLNRTDDYPGIRHRFAYAGILRIIRDKMLEMGMGL